MGHIVWVTLCGSLCVICVIFVDVKDVHVICDNCNILLKGLRSKVRSSENRPTGTSASLLAGSTIKKLTIHIFVVSLWFNSNFQS